MSRRSLNGIESDDVRSLNGLSIHSKMLKKLKATEPLEYDADTFTYSLKGLSGFSANKVIKVNSSGTALEYATDSTIDLDTAVSYSSQAGSDISFGNPTTLRKITMNTGEFKITSGIGEKGSCKLIVEADNNDKDGYDTSLPEIQLKSDAGTVLAKMKLADNNLKIIHEGDYDVEIGANNQTQLKLNESDVYCYKSFLSISAYANGKKPGIYFVPFHNSDDFGKYLKLVVDINDVSPIAGRELIMPNVNDTIVCKATTDSMTNKTLYNAIYDGDAGANARLRIQDSNKSHKINILAQDLTNDINLTLGNTTGTIAIQSEIPTNTEIRALLSATNPITYNNTTGAIGWTNSESYITLTNIESYYNFGTSTTTDITIGRYDNGKNTDIRGNAITFSQNGSTFTLPGSSGVLATTGQVPATSANSTNFGTTAGANINIGNASYITKIMGAINVDGTLFTQLNCDNGILVSNGNTSQGFIKFNENIINGSKYVMLQPSASLSDNFTLTMPSITDTLITRNSVDTLTNKSISYSQLTGTPTIPSLDTATSYSAIAGGNISFGNDTTLRNITMHTGEFKISSGVGSNGDCKLVIEADTDDAGGGENSNPEIKFLADGGGNVARLYLDNNDFKIIHEDDYDIQIGANNTTQLKLNNADVEVYKSALSISSTGTSTKPVLWFVPFGNADNFNKSIQLEADITDSTSGTHTTLTLPRRDGETLATTTDITSAINVSTDTITGNPQRNFGNALSQYVINASNFFVYATGQNFFDSANSNCEVVIKAGDTASDSYSTRLTFYTKGNTKRAEIFKNTGDEFVIKNIDERLELGGENDIQLKMDANDVRVYKSDFTISAYTSSAYPRIFFLPNKNADDYANRICLNSYQYDNFNNGQFDVYLLPFNSDLCQSRSGTSSSRYLNFWTNSNTSTKLRQDVYGNMSEGASSAQGDGTDKAYPFSFRSTGISSSSFPYFFNLSNSAGDHWGFHTNGVGDNLIVEQQQDFKFINADLIGDTNTGHAYSKLCLGDVFCQDIFADDVYSDGVQLTSDRRLKKDIKPIENAIDTINKLECKTFLKKVNPQDDIWGNEWRQDSGFIAQDLYNDVPELQHIVNGVETDISSNFVNGKLIDNCVGYKIVQTKTDTSVSIDTDPSGNANPNAGKHLTDATYEKVLDPNKKLSLNYEEIIPYCCKAIQELDAIVKQQQEQINLLLSKLNV